MRRLAASYMCRQDYVRIGVGTVFTVGAINPRAACTFVIIACEQHHERHDVRSDEGMDITAVDALGMFYRMSLYRTQDDSCVEQAYPITVRFGA